MTLQMGYRPASSIELHLNNLHASYMPILVLKKDAQLKQDDYAKGDPLSPKKDVCRRVNGKYTPVTVLLLERVLYEINLALQRSVVRGPGSRRGSAYKNLALQE